MSNFKTQILRMLLLLSFFMSAGFWITTPLARADETQPRALRIFTWPSNQVGYDLGMRALGHFGRGVSQSAPNAGFFIQAGAHYWYEHMVEGHVNLGVGLTSSFFTFGLGGRLNLLEFVDDPTGEVLAKGLQRGVAAHILKNFMLYLGLEYFHYSFPDPTVNTGISSPTSFWALQPGLGVQWYFHVGRVQWARRFYVDTALSYTNINSNNFLLPYIGFGVEMR